VLVPSYDRALHALRTLLDSWSGIGHVAVGMHRQGYDLQLMQYDKRGWRATFYPTGMEHSPTGEGQSDERAALVGELVQLADAAVRRLARAAGWLQSVARDAI
jgi:hypothetical protein